MSAEATPELRSQRIKEFLQMLPLTVEIAALTPGDPNRFLTPDQMESRATALRNGYKIARKILREIGDEGQ
jgi:hypothetical protein